MSAEAKGGIAITGTHDGNAYAGPGEVHSIGGAGSGYGGVAVPCLNLSCDAMVPSVPGSPGFFLCPKCGHRFFSAGGGGWLANAPAYHTYLENGWQDVSIVRGDYRAIKRFLSRWSLWVALLGEGFLAGIFIKGLLK
jgi:hypothetical protein